MQIFLSLRLQQSLNIHRLFVNIMLLLQTAVMRRQVIENLFDPLVTCSRLISNDLTTYFEIFLKHNLKFTETDMISTDFESSLMYSSV